MNEQTAAVQRMQDYIEEHLEADITLAELSAVSLFSPWHSCRLFKELLGVTPAEIYPQAPAFSLCHASERGAMPCDGSGF